MVFVAAIDPLHGIRSSTNAVRKLDIGGGVGSDLANRHTGQPVK